MEQYVLIQPKRTGETVTAFGNSESVEPIASQMKRLSLVGKTCKCDENTVQTCLMTLYNQLQIKVYLLNVIYKSLNIIKYKVCV